VTKLRLREIQAAQTKFKDSNVAAAAAPAGSSDLAAATAAAAALAEVPATISAAGADPGVISFSQAFSLSSRPSAVKKIILGA